MAKQAHPTSSSSRRAFLRSALSAGAGAATVALTANTAVAAAETAAEEAQTAPAARRGYRLTRHVADYYKTAAF